MSNGEEKWKRKLKELVKDFLRKKEVEGVEVFLFGSRVWGKPQRVSDFDLAIKAEKNICAELKEFLEESTFPYEVDVVRWDDLPEEMRRKISTQGEKWL